MEQASTPTNNSKFQILKRFTPDIVYFQKTNFKKLLVIPKTLQHLC